MKKCIVLAIAGALFVTQIPVMAESGCAFYDQYGYHDWEYGDYVQPSCTEWGYAQYVCSSCGTWEPEDIPPWGHIWKVSEEFYSTCVSYGYVEYTCSLCASSYKEDTYPQRDLHHYRLKIQNNPSTLFFCVPYYNLTNKK